MVDEFELKKCRCLQCGHEWIPRKEHPVACPNCKRRTWNMPKTGILTL